MAKDQDLPLNPLRISGACGKLMCCLKYEHPLYQDFVETAPAIGERVDGPEGEGVVVGHNVPSDTVVVRLQADGRRVACPKASVCVARKSYDGMVADGGRTHAEAEGRPAGPQMIELTTIEPVTPGDSESEGTDGGTGSARRSSPSRQRRRLRREHDIPEG
jgi:cell fate regulator YaaT (PSP1 superfamily)